MLGSNAADSGRANDATSQISDTRDMDDSYQQLESQCQHQFLAELLRSTAPELCAAAARRLSQVDPTIKARYGEISCHRWKDLFQTWINDLAAAVSVCRPSILHRQVAWTKSVFGARSVSEKDIIAALTALRDVVTREVPEEDRALVSQYITETIERVSNCPGCPPCDLSPECPVGHMALEYVMMMLEGDRRTASEFILSAVKAGLPIRDMYLGVLLPAMRELGRMWECDEIDVAEEHFCSATTELVLSQLYPYIPRKPWNNKIAVVAAAEGNLHQIGVRMVADFLEMDGWRSVYLGGNVPSHDLALAVVDFKADVLAIAACLPAHLQGISDAVSTVRACPEASGVKIIVGGQGFEGTDDLWRTYGADAFAMTFDEAVAAANELTRAVIRTIP